MALNQSDCGPHPPTHLTMSGDIFWSQLGGGRLLAASGWRPVRLPNTLQYTGLPLNKDHRIPNAHNENPWIRKSSIPSGSKATAVPSRRVSLGEGAAKTPSRLPASEGSGRKSEGESGRRRGTAQAAQGGSVPLQPVCGGACHPVASEPGSRRTQTGGGPLCVRARTPLCPRGLRAFRGGGSWARPRRCRVGTG